MNPWTTQLTPLSYLQRSAEVFPDKTALVHGDSSWTYKQLLEAVELRARALRAARVEPGDRVAYMMPNLPETLISMFAVPLIDAVLVPVNTRLAPQEVRYIADHSGAKLFVVDTQFWPTVARVAQDFKTVETVVLAEDPTTDGAYPPARDADDQDDDQDAAQPRVVSIEDFLADAARDTAALEWSVQDEEQTLSINYTSGTTGRPKGVMYTHRGAYLNVLSEIFHSGFGTGSQYLWTLPMFHCNGWCTGWALVAAGGTQHCLREVRGPEIWRQIDHESITHLNGAPTVVATIMDAAEAHDLEAPLTITTAGAPPSPTILKRMSAMGFNIVHVYGLTETYGPVTVNQWQDGWSALSPDEKAERQSRQGVGMLTAEHARVVSLDSPANQLVDVPSDGDTLGEIVLRGNNVMKGYYRDPEATDRAFEGGWFHSGDLGVMHPDGYIEVRDRAKDVVVSGGENISTIEVEKAVAAFAGVVDVAVVGVPDDRWGERPKAFVVLAEGHRATQEEVLEFLRDRLARYKNPREVEFVAELPKTSTGKIQKFALREKEWQGREKRVQG
jgi:fatty-acyl-CoA synthase